LNGSVQKVAVVVSSEGGQPLERFVACLALLSEQQQRQEEEGVGLGEQELERALKDCLLKLQFRDAALRPLPNGCTFEVVTYSTDPDVAPQLWVEEAPQPGERSPPPV
jgi:hypothetical protein